MIEIVKGPVFKVGQQFFASIGEAQALELAGVLVNCRNPELTDDERSGIADHLIENRAAVIDILTMTKRSLPKARKINGGSKKRKSAALGNLTPASEPA